ELRANVLEFAQDLRRLVETAAKPAERQVRLPHPAAGALACDPIFRDDGVVYLGHPACFAVTPHLDEKRLDECAFRLCFAQLPAIGPCAQPLDKLRTSVVAQIRPVFEVEFRTQKGARYKGAAVIEHGHCLAAAISPG